MAQPLYPLSPSIVSTPYMTVYSTSHQRSIHFHTTPTQHDVIFKYCLSLSSLATQKCCASAIHLPVRRKKENNWHVLYRWCSFTCKCISALLTTNCCQLTSASRFNMPTIHNKAHVLMTNHTAMHLLLSAMGCLKHNPLSCKQFLDAKCSHYLSNFRHHSYLKWHSKNIPLYMAFCLHSLQKLLFN